MTSISLEPTYNSYPHSLLIPSYGYYLSQLITYNLCFFCFFNLSQLMAILYPFTYSLLVVAMVIASASDSPRHRVQLQIGSETKAGQNRGLLNGIFIYR